MIRMCQYKEVFSIVFEAHMIDPYFHAGEDVFDGEQDFAKACDFLERPGVWIIVNF